MGRLLRTMTLECVTLMFLDDLAQFDAYPVFDSIYQ